jgi:hypothetical protein
MEGFIHFLEFINCFLPTIIYYQKPRWRTTFSQTIEQKNASLVSDIAI